MSQAKSNPNRTLFSVVGVLVVFAIVVAVNYIARAIPAQVDFTEDNLHTLSDGSRKILEKLDTPVTVKLYVTGDDDVMPPQLQTQAREVEAFLTDYVRASDGMVQLERYDPQPDTDEEDAARIAGIQANPTGRGDLYFGAAVTSLDQKVVLPFLPQIPGELLEYEVTRAISEVSNPEKAVVGIMSTLPVSGGMGNPMAGQPDPAWFVYEQLQRDFEVRTLEQDVEQIEDDVNTLVLIHAAELTEGALFAIDQFLLRGGKLAVFLDAFSLVAQSSQPQNPMMRQQAPTTPTSSNLEKLLSTWGFRFESTQVVADLTYKTGVRGGNEIASWLTIPTEGMNDDDVLTNRLGSVEMVLAGAFSGDAVKGLQKDVLLTSSKASSLVDPFSAQRNDPSIVAEFKSDNEAKVLALRLAGTFETAFPNGKPDTGDDEADDEAGPDGPETDESPDGTDAADEDVGEGFLKSSAKESAVVLFADTDMIYDQFAVQVQQFLGQRFAQPLNGNLALFQNVVEQLSGDTDLIAIRSRGSARRPFTRIKEMEEQANAKIRDELKKLEEERREAERKINELQTQKDDTQKFAFTAEQQAEIEKFQKAAADAAIERRNLQKEARAEYNSLIARIKAANILTIPIVVALVGLVIFFVRRSKTGAR